MLPLRGPPFSEGPRRRGNGAAEAHQSADLKTGSLDRDGVWRPNRLPMSLGAVGGSPSPVAHGLSYAPSPLLADLTGGQHLRHSARFFSPFGAGSGGYEVPIFVVHSTTTPAPTPSFRRRTLSPNSTSVQRGEPSDFVCVMFKPILRVTHRYEPGIMRFIYHIFHNPRTLWGCHKSEKCIVNMTRDSCQCLQMMFWMSPSALPAIILSRSNGIN